MKQDEVRDQIYIKCSKLMEKFFIKFTIFYLQTSEHIKLHFIKNLLFYFSRSQPALSRHKHIHTL